MYRGVGEEEAGIGKGEEDLSTNFSVGTEIEMN